MLTLGCSEFERLYVALALIVTLDLVFLPHALRCKPDYIAHIKSSATGVTVATGNGRWDEDTPFLEGDTTGVGSLDKA